MSTPPEHPDAFEQVELSTLDLRYEGCRMKQASLEERLAGSILQRGIEMALEGVEVDGVRVLLNGFKRYRCARKLNLARVPYRSLGRDEATGILKVLREANDRGLALLEQATFLDELRRTRQLSLGEIAAELSRSKAWVSLRLGLLAEISPRVRQELFAGAFPVYAYMYSVRPFMRINGVGAERVEEFVLAVSGRGLSVRQIEMLAQGFFRGSEAVRREITRGNLALCLEQLRPLSRQHDGCNEFEQVLLTDLEVTQKYMQRVIGKSKDERIRTPAFHAQSQLLAGGILSRSRGFFRSVRNLHDRNRQT